MLTTSRTESTATSPHADRVAPTSARKDASAAQAPKVDHRDNAGHVAGRASISRHWAEPLVGTPRLQSPHRNRVATGYSPSWPEHPHGQAAVAEQRLEGVVEHVEAAGEGAERGHHQPAPVADEAGPADRIAVHGEPRRRMHVAGDLVRDATGGRLVAQRDAADGQFAERAPAQRRRDLGIVVAGEPDPLPILLHDAEDLQILDRHAPRGADIVHAVAQRNDARRLVAVDHLGQAHQGLARVVGRQQAAALGVGGSLFQVQVRHQQRRFARPVERAGIVGDELLAAQRHRLRHRLQHQVETFRLQLEHALPLLPRALIDALHGLAHEVIGRRAQNILRRAAAVNQLLADFQQHRHGQRRHPVQRLVADVAP